jgi:O2-independent ubiquinone biosynthesis protein UbiU
MELVAPAGTLASLREAVDAGADTVYVGFRDETNARNFPGLNFTPKDLADGLAYAHARGRKVYVAINTFPRAGEPEAWDRAVAQAAELGVDAVILADIGLLAAASSRFPALRLHLSVQAAAAESGAIGFYRRAFGVRRVVLPRVLTLAEVAALTAAVAPVETEVFAFGGMCPMAEGRCSLSSYVTGESPNRNGVCSPANHVHYQERDGALISRLGAFTVNRFGAGEAAGYPTLCKGRFSAAGRIGYLFEEPTSLDVAAVLDELKAAGVAALKIEGRQRGRAYVAAAVAAWRGLIDGKIDPAAALSGLTEGGRATQGALKRTWR